MQLTGAERATLEENGVPRQQTPRVETLLEPLDQHQVEDGGAEAPWALARLIQRAEEGFNAVGSISEAHITP